MDAPTTWTDLAAVILSNIVAFLLGRKARKRKA